MPELETYIPVIDIGHITSPETTEEDLKAFGIQLLEALKKCGFLYFVNHGFDKDLLDRLESNALSFFNLDEKTKLKYTHNLLRGYQPIGIENLEEATQDKLSKAKNIKKRVIPVDAYRESFDYCRYKEEQASMDVTEVPTFESTMAEFCKVARQLTEKLLKALEYALEMPRGTLLELHRGLIDSWSNNISTGRILYYPGINEDEMIPEGSLRCGTHTDYGTFTFLFQDNIGGLEILNNNNEWQPAIPMEGAVIFNIADNVETLTAGILTARKHRVVFPENKEHRKNSRLSYTFFVKPDNDVTVKPLFPCPSGKYPTVNAFQHTLQKTQNSRKHVESY